MSDRKRMEVNVLILSENSEGLAKSIEASGYCQGHSTYLLCVAQKCERARVEVLQKYLSRKRERERGGVGWRDEERAVGEGKGPTGENGGVQGRAALTLPPDVYIISMAIALGRSLCGGRC